MGTISNQLNTLLLVLVLLSVLALIGMVATRGSAGPLEPPDVPASTGIPIDEAGSWSRTLSDVGGCSSPRFKCVMPTAAQPTGEAVLDRETGLVWQRQVTALESTWLGALLACNLAITGNRLGWRLPAEAELRSLSDTDNDGVFAGMPLFPGGTADRQYWTATTYPDPATTAYMVDYDSTLAVLLNNKSDLNGAWCVRGPSPWEG